jgi:hypothetical protein
MKRSTSYLLITLLVLAIASYLALQREGETSAPDSSGDTLVDYDSTAVDKLEITTSTNTVVLEKQAGTWMLTHPLTYRADENAVTAAVGKGRSIITTSLVSSNPGKQSLFQVDSTGTMVKVYEKGTLKATFFIGKTSTSFTDTYVRLDGSTEVFAAQGILSSQFQRQVKDWRDKSVFRMDEGAIKNVTFRYGDTTFTLSLQDSVWRIGKDEPDQAGLRPLLSALSSIQADGFVDSGLTVLPRLVAIIDIEGTQIRFFKRDDTTYLVQTSASPQWFEVQSWRTASLLKRKKDLLTTKA